MLPAHVPAQPAASPRPWCSGAAPRATGPRLAECDLSQARKFPTHQSPFALTDGGQKE